MTRTRTTWRQRLLAKRRGVAAVLSMMFMVLFGSLAAAMAVVSQGNLRTANSHLVVSRALGCVDTGMTVAIACDGAAKYVSDYAAFLAGS